METREETRPPGVWGQTERGRAHSLALTGPGSRPTLTCSFRYSARAMRF